MAVTQQKTHWGKVIVYYLIACAISWPFFWWRDILHWEGYTGPKLLRASTYMWGPGIAAIVCFIIFRKVHKRTITFAGNSWLKSLAFWFLPLILFTILGVETPADVPEGTFPYYSILFPLYATGFGILYVLGEELGWRGFLQDALRGVKPVYKYMLIGTMWELWHFTNRTHDKTLSQILLTLSITIPCVILLSFLIGWAAERSKSLIVAVTLHSWVNIAAEMPSVKTYITFGVAIVFWIWILYKWDNKDHGTLSATT